MSFSRFILIILFCQSLIAQTADVNDSIYKVASQSVYNNLSKSDELTKFLLKHSSSDIYENSLLTNAKIEYLKGNYLQGIESLFELKKLNNKQLKPYVSLEIANYYQKLGLSQYSKREFSSINNFKFPSIYLYQSKIEKNTDISLKLLHKGLRANLGNNVEMTPQLNEQFYLRLAQIHETSDSSIYYYKLILSLFDANKENILYKSALIGYNDLVFSKINSIDNNNLDLLKRINLNEIDFENRRDLNILLAKYYFSKNKINEYRASVNELNKLDSIDEINTIKARNFIISNFNAENSKGELKTNYRVLIIITLAILFFIGILIYIRLYKHKKELIKTNLNVSNSDAESNNKTITPEKTEFELLKKLHEFEVLEKFLEKQISLPNLAEQFGTNIRYLSEIINKNKNKNFNQYLNELRINYIIQKMENEPRYLNYKIQALADECGFSSLSVFSVTFKSITGISPMTYAKQIKEKNN